MRNRDTPYAATLVVAASDSLNKCGANFVCDGTDDQVEIQAAIDALPTGGGYPFGGGKVALLEGNFNFSDEVDVGSGANQNIAIIGSTGTYINWSANPATQSYLFRVNVAGGTCTFRDIYMYGANYANSGGIYVTSANPCNIDHVYINAVNHGVYHLIEGVVTGCRITNCPICIQAYGRCEIAGNHLRSKGAGTVILMGVLPDVTVTGNTIIGEETGAWGIKFQAPADHCSIVGNTFRDCQGGGILMSEGVVGEHNIITGNAFYKGDGADPSFGIACGGSHNVITSNTFHDLVKAIHLYAASSENTVGFNNINSCTAGIANLGTGNILEHNLES